MLAVASVCCACGDLKDRVETLEQKVSVQRRYCLFYLKRIEWKRR